MRSIVCIAHNIRSAHNVGSLFRTCDGIDTKKLVLSGYSPHPYRENETRLPHEYVAIQKQLKKTALGAEQTIPWEYSEDIVATLQQLKSNGYKVVALEQTTTSVPLPKFQPPDMVAILLGREVEGIEPELLELCDDVIEIPMFGDKESYNVVQAAAMAMYHCRFWPFTAD